MMMVMMRPMGMVLTDRVSQWAIQPPGAQRAIQPPGASSMNTPHSM